MMTLNMLAELVANLQKQGHGDKVVVLSSDPEGNGFRPLANEYGEGWMTPQPGMMSTVQLHDHPVEDGVEVVSLWPGYFWKSAPEGVVAGTLE